MPGGALGGVEAEGAVLGGSSGEVSPEGIPAGESSGEGEESGLSELDLAVLDIAGRNWLGPGPRDRAIRERLGMSPTAYFQHLNVLLDDPRALRHAPVTVNRWRATRSRHASTR